MISRTLYWQTIFKDRIFLVLFVVAVAVFILSLFIRQPALEQSPIPFELTLTFFIVNILFALLTIRREPLLSYMFLTATILINSTLYFYIRYLLLIQTV